MTNDSREAKDTTPETETSSLTSVRSRRSRGLFKILTNSLRVVAHLSRARGVEELTEPTIDLVIDDHELYIRSDLKSKRSDSTVNNVTNASGGDLNMGEGNSSAFKCVKISLIILYVLSIIAAIFFTAIAIFGLAIIGSTNGDPYHKISPEEKEEAQAIFTGAIIVFAISLIVAIIGLIGVIKENKCIIITITVLSALGVIGHFIKGDIGSALVSILVTILTGIYAHMIIEKQKRNSSV